MDERADNWDRLAPTRIPHFLQMLAEWLPGLSRHYVSGHARADLQLINYTLERYLEIFEERKRMSKSFGDVSQVVKLASTTSKLHELVKDAKRLQDRAVAQGKERSMQYYSVWKSIYMYKTGPLMKMNVVRLTSI